MTDPAIAQLLGGSLASVPYVVVRRDTGAVVRYGECPSNVFAAQATNPMEVAVPGDLAWTAAWQIRTPPGSPNPPPNHMRWNFVAKVWEPDPEDPA
jgi:hypothetical protein